MKKKAGGPVPDLPVDPERLRKQFPALTEGDLEAYVAVTRRVLGRPPAQRGTAVREVLEAGRRAREEQAAGQQVGPEAALALRYLDAVDKMQGPTRRGEGH